MRKLASIRRIDTLAPIDGADKIELATVGGWKVVVNKGLYNVGDLAVYFEIDSWIPNTLAPFLSKGKEPREFEGVKGERLRTVKLRGQLSQGLLMPYREAIPFAEQGVLVEGDDVTELLGIRKWEIPLNTQLAGMARGNFPTAVPKTDQERCQNLSKELSSAVEQKLVFEVTEKIDGSSCTMYLSTEGEFEVCSRNLSLKLDENNAFWKAAIRFDVENKMRAANLQGYAIQGELSAPGVQGNAYNFKDIEFFVFDVYNANKGEYLKPADRRLLIQQLGLKHVPVIDTQRLLPASIEGLLEEAEGESVLYKTKREGLVFKQVDGEFTFKAISNSWLLKNE